MVKKLPANACIGQTERQVQSLGQEDPLEEGVATHSSILAWRIPWTEEPGSLQSIGLQELDMTEVTEHAHTKSRLILILSHIHKVPLAM